ncbi:hypothetical protein ABG067_005838 [Albugo candida]
MSERNRRIPFGNKAKKKQLQLKREKNRARLHKNSSEEEECDKVAPISEPIPTTTRGLEKDLRSIFELESKSVINARKRDATRPLVEGAESDFQYSLYATYKLHHLSNQAPILCKPKLNPKNMTPDEWHDVEEQSYNCWINEIKAIQSSRNDSACINLFERNLNTWRELWRVIEQTQILVHLVDSRCPLLHLSDQLIQYLLEMKKSVVVILTKTDLVSLDRVDSWIQYIRNTFASRLPVMTYSVPESKVCNNTFFQVIKDIIANDTSHSSPTWNLGFVGEPNVGKSTLLNTLFEKKLVSSSQTPGHTKHLQSHYYPDVSSALDGINVKVEKLQVFDCPGIVFPRFNVPPSLQILFGSFPIAQVREPYSCIRMIAENCRPTLMDVYKLKSIEEEDEWSPWTIAEAYAEQRGFRSKGGKTDVYRAANLILRNTLKGEKVVLSFPPPKEQSHSSVFQGMTDT